MTACRGRGGVGHSQLPHSIMQSTLSSHSSQGWPLQGHVPTETSQSAPLTTRLYLCLLLSDASRGRGIPLWSICRCVPVCCNMGLGSSGRVQPIIGNASLTPDRPV